MKKQLLFLLSFNIIICQLSAQISAACGNVCKNPGFEKDTAFWTYATGSACNTSPVPCNQVLGFSNTQHFIKTAGQMDAIEPSLPAVPSWGGQKSLMLGDSSNSAYGASIAKYTFMVMPGNSYFQFGYALVLQDEVAGHTDPEKAYFAYNVYDPNNTIIASKKIRRNTPNINFQNATNMGSVKYLNWTKDTVQLAQYIGQCVTFEFITSDCAQGGHWGYAYIDGVCDSMLSGIQEQEMNNFNIYPNPSNGIFTINSSNTDNYSIEIYNMIGALVFKDNSKSKKYVFNQAILETGMYFVNIRDEKGIIKTEKIVIK